MAQNIPPPPVRRFPWWLAILAVLFAVRFFNSYQHNSIHPNATDAPAAPVMQQSSAPKSGSPTPFQVMTSSQDGEKAVHAACDKDVDRTETGTKSDMLRMVKSNAASIIQACSSAYEDGVKDAAQDTGDAHFLDEANAASEEEMVGATMGIVGDKIGEADANNKALTLAKDVVRNSTQPDLVRHAKETVNEIAGPLPSTTP